MNCPEHLLFKVRGVYVWLYWRDVPRETIPLVVWLNPLRYEISGHVFGKYFRINRYGARGARLAQKVSEVVCWIAGHPESTNRIFCPRCKAIHKEQTP